MGTKSDTQRGDQPFIGVDLGGTNILAGVVTSKNKVLSRSKNKTKAEKGVDEVINRIIETINEAVEEAKLSVDEIGGLGIGAPGTIDFQRGVVINAVNLRWNDVQLAKIIEERLGVSVVVDNDVNVGTWGEHVAGAGKGFDDVLGVFVGTGVGGGLVLNGQLYRGYHKTAGEIGHTVLCADAPLGRRTFENLASRTAIANLATQLIRSNHQSKISELAQGNLDGIRSKVLAQATKDRDDLAEQLVQQAAHYVGVGIANALTLLSLPCVVLGGGFTSALGDIWIGWVREAFEAYVFPSDLKVCRILGSKLDDDAGIIGAADLARGILK